MSETLNEQMLKNGVLNSSTTYCQKCGSLLDPAAQHKIDPPSPEYEPITVCDTCYNSIKNGTMHAYQAKSTKTSSLEDTTIKHAATDAFFGSVDGLRLSASLGIPFLLFGILLCIIGIFFSFVMIFGILLITVGVVFIVAAQLRFSAANKRKAKLSRERADAQAEAAAEAQTQAQAIEDAIQQMAQTHNHAAPSTTVSTGKDALDRIHELERLLENKMITQEDFDRRKEKILDEI